MENKEIKDNTFLEKRYLSAQPKAQPTTKVSSPSPSLSAKKQTKGDTQNKTTNGFKVIKYENKRLLKEDPKLIYDGPEKKTGYLFIHKNKEAITKKELYLLPIRCTMTKASLNLFLSNDASTLFKSIKLPSIERISQQKVLKDNHCFDVIMSEKKDGEMVDIVGPTLCTKTKEEMQSWAEKILKLKESLIQIKNEDKNVELMRDFHKVKELLKEEKTKGPEKLPEKERIKQLFYNSADKATRKNPANVVQEQIITKSITTIMKDITEADLEKNKVQRTMKDQLQKARKFAEEVHKKNEKIEEIIEKKEESEMKKEANLIIQKAETKEKQLLDAVRKRIVKMKKEESKTYKETYMKEIKEEKKKAAEESRAIARKIEETNRNIPYDRCTDPRLKSFKDSDYIHQTCIHIYGENVSF
jgi:hypothetical protein